MGGGATSAAGALEVFVYRLPLRPPEDEPRTAACGSRVRGGTRATADDSANAETTARPEGQLQERDALPQPEWIEPLLRQNAVWFCRLRWMVVAALALVGLAGLFPDTLLKIGLAIEPAWPWAVAGVLVALNLGFISSTRRVAAAGVGVSVRGLLWAQIVTDLLVLTVVIHWLGSGLPAAPFMYLFHIILACMVFSPRESLGVAGMAAAFFLLCLLLESLGLLGRPSVLVGAAALDGAGRPAIGSTVIPMLSTWLVIWYLVSRLANALRARDRELYVANQRLKASIEERSKHMLQTTHQLKAPFAAIHAQTQLLLGNYCGALPDTAKTVAERIAARCLVLARQIQEMLQLANLRSQGQTPPPATEINLRALVEEVITRVEPAARQRGIRFEKDLDAMVVRAVGDHLMMVVDNLLVNAVNYSYDNGVVEVACRGGDSGTVALVVRDHGIGIPREKLPRIFDDYYRTEEAVQHNRSSTGLGLAIVRQVACEDRLAITVESAPGWGTRLTVSLPGRPWNLPAPATTPPARPPVDQPEPREVRRPAPTPQSAEPAPVSP